MLAVQTPRPGPKPEIYSELLSQAGALLQGERDATANSANLSSLVFHTLPDLNWVGFYWMKGGELVLGAFQGKPACVRIALGKGVCGTAARDAKVIIVDDVHQFPGHIACDTASASEIVLPLILDDRVIGVLDLDSPKPWRFDDTDAVGLEALVQVYLAATDFGS